MPGRAKNYRVQEFAELTGVTIRALHHYDRIGLLKPRRSGKRYRVYTDADVLRLQQIVVLKYLGLPLAGIREALEGEARLREFLKDRRFAIGRQRARLAVQVDMLDELDGARGGVDWPELADFVRSLGAGGERSWNLHRLDHARRLIAERRREWNMTLQDYELSRDIRAAIERGDTPDTPAGQTLVARWRDAIERFTNGDAALKEALALVMKDRANRPRPTWSAGYREYFDRAVREAS